jgi:hypothetical protein
MTAAVDAVLSFARGRPVLVLLRVVNLAFFLATAAYCILSFSTFAYQQFIRPEVLAWPSTFVVLNPPLFWLCSLLTAWTLVPHLSGPRRHRMAIAYLGASLAVGVTVAFTPLLDRVGNDGYSLAAGLLALAFPAWLAVVDHRICRPIEPTVPSDADALRTCLATALAVWMSYAVAAPLRLGRAAGIELDARALLVSWIASAAAHLAVFAVAFLLLNLVFRAARRMSRPGTAAYWLTLALAAGALAAVLQRVGFETLGFAVWAGWVAAAAMSATTILSWSGLVRHFPVNEEEVSRDVLSMLSGPCTALSCAARPFAVLAVPVAALATGDLFARLDWNFLLQKLTVVAVWAGAFALVHNALTRPVCVQARWSRPAVKSGAVLTTACLLSAALPQVSAWTGDRRLQPELLFDQYAAIDPSFLLIRDTSRMESPDTAGFYQFLKAHSGIVDDAIRPIDIDFARPLARPAERPHIFLFVLDSLRRDYLSPYNPEVSFTPSFDAFARESVVFERAFSRYSGTGLAVPSIWAGGMVLHKQYIQPFAPMNALAKLLDAAGYRRVMSIDSIADQLIPRRPDFVVLDRGIRNVEFRLCRTIGELKTVIETRNDAPFFFYSLPQDLHIANIQSSSRRLDGSQRFAAPVVERVRAIDECFGSFIEFLKRTGMYDNSIVIVTSDHGDSLGEEGRWGHSYTLFPEVVRIPLIIHLPASLAPRATADGQDISFSADITPSLYRLLGYQPRDLGPLYGRSLFGLDGVRPDARQRTDEPLLVASSYGAVYGVLRRNGRSLYIADGVSGRDYAFDLSGPRDVRLTITNAMREANWDVIRRQVQDLSASYGYRTRS